MIFQTSIDLNIENVQAVIDFDTGLIGFTKMVDGNTVEFNYFNSPTEYRVAFLKAIEPIQSSNNTLNFEISRKSEVAQVLRSFYQK